MIAAGSQRNPVDCSSSTLVNMDQVGVDSLMSFLDGYDIQPLEPAATASLLS